MAENPTLQISFRPVTHGDVELLMQWLAQPFVYRWWHQEFSRTAVESHFGSMFDGSSTTHGFIVSIDDTPVGFIQYYFYSDEPDSTADISQVTPVHDNDGSIDYFIGDARHVGKGIGRQIITAFCAQLRAELPHLDGLIVAVHADNPASWKCLQHAGFTIVGRGYFAPDNPDDSREHFVLEQR